MSLVDLSPLLRLALLGLVLALAPLAWLWVRHRGADASKRLRALTLLTLFLTFDLILVGAYTRLSDSGLGCPDWPGCYGAASPLGARDHIAAAQSALPSGPVTHRKAWVEMLHRYFGMGLGVVHQSSQFAAIRTLPTITLLPAFTRVDAALFAKLGDRVDLQLNIENLLNTTYFSDAHNADNITTGAPRNARLTLRMRF